MLRHYDFHLQKWVTRHVGNLMLFMAAHEQQFINGNRTGEAVCCKLRYRIDTLPLNCRLYTEYYFIGDVEASAWG